MTDDSALIRIKTGSDQWNLLRVQDIICVKSFFGQRDTVAFCTSDHQFTETGRNILTISELLKQQHFLFANKYCLVNMRYVIRIENICSDDNPSHSESVSQLTHGYGLINVRNIVEKYNGLYYQETADGKYSTTVSIPILRDSVGAIIRQPASFERYEPNIN